LRAHRGALPWWDAHWARLARGAARLGLTLPEAARVRREAHAMLGGDDAVLKLQVTRGAGGRGYAPPDDAEPTWLLSRHPVPASIAQGLAIIWCETRLADQPALAGLKHCNRLEQVLGRREVIAAGAQEGLMCDGAGWAVSATSANLFVLRAGRWSTPPVDRCGVAGVCRAHLLSALQAGERDLSREDVESADAVFLCNAVRGILAVARVGARDIALHPAIEDARRSLSRLHPAFPMETP
jgi:4-amino-4-deoxychorismate lyase